MVVVARSLHFLTLHTYFHGNKCKYYLLNNKIKRFSLVDFIL